MNDNFTKCNIKEPHSHLVFGKEFECEKGCREHFEHGGHIYTVNGQDACCNYTKLETVSTTPLSDNHKEV